MKKLIISILILLIYGCDQDSNRIIDTDPAEYSHLNTAQPENYTELFSLINADIQKSVMDYKEQHNIPDEDIPGEFHGRALINSKGELEKIYLLNSVHDKIDQMILDMVKNFEYKPGKIENKPVPYKFDFRYKNRDYFLAADEMPEPVGGISAIAQKVRYPEIAKRAGIEGRVFVKAIIDTEGNVVETEIIKGLGAGIDEAAIEAIKNSKFTPGKINGKAVKVQVTIPILFKLQ